ncbi:hypothetical protein Tco_1536443, partial [Tanacetum coccineum]
MFDIDYLTDSMNYILVSLENQTNPHAGTSELTNSAGTLQTPYVNASEELIVAPTEAKHTAAKKEAYPTGIPEDTPESLAFRRELVELAQKQLREVPKNKATKLTIFNKPQKGIFDEASYDDEGMVHDFNNLPTEVAVSPIPTLRIHNIHPQSQILGDPKSSVQTRSRVQQHSGVHALMTVELEASKLKRTCINLQAKVFKKQKITDVPDVTKYESVKREEKFKVQQPILRYNVRKSLARKGLHKNKSESARSDTEEDVEAYMDERVDEPSSEEFQMGSISQGSAPAKIVKWQILKTGKKGAYQIIREDHTYVVYVNFPGLLNDLTIDDLKELYRLMILKYGDSRPEEEYERLLWGDLKTMFDPPYIEDAVWSLTHQQKVLSWRYFHSCAVYCLTLEAAHIYMLTEVKYPLPSRVCQAMLEK